MRPTMGLACALIVSTTALGQPYPPFPDRTHPSLPPPYPLQGPSQIQQLGHGAAEQGASRYTAAGVPNGLGAAADDVRIAQEAHRAGRQAARSHEPVAEPAPVRLPRGMTLTDFHPSPQLPRGVTEALMRVLPSGGLELYLLLPAGGAFPAHFVDSTRHVTFVEGSGQVGTGEGPLVPAGPGTRFTVPAGAHHEITCGDRAGCLLFVRTDGPLQVHWLYHR